MSGAWYKQMNHDPLAAEVRINQTDSLPMDRMLGYPPGHSGIIFPNADDRFRDRQRAWARYDLKQSLVGGA